MKNRISKLVFIVVASLTILLVISCQSQNNIQENSIFPTETSEKALELIYDSTVFINDEFNSFLNCEIYFSDLNKNIWKFHVYKNLSSMHGYKLYDEKGSKQYIGARFYIEWNFQGSTTKKGQDTTLNRIEELMLKEPQKYLKRNLVKLVPENDIEKMINDANAGDSIVLESGIYYLNNGLSISADYLTLSGEPGCFIYANSDYNVLDVDAHFVKLKNLYLSHLNAENAACSGDVIVVNSFRCSSIVVEGCDINGCGVIGINLYATDKNENLNYVFKHNFIHNNSQAAILIDGQAYQNEVSRFKGIAFENNKIWNNGKDKTDDPVKFKNIFTFGLIDSLRTKISGSCPNSNVYHFNKLEDKQIPFYGTDDTQIIGYVNPINFSNGKKKGVLVYERFEPVKFYDKIPKVLCDSNKTGESLKLVIVYSDPKAVEEYFEEGGEDWTWFVEEVWNYYEKQNITVKSSSSFSEEEMNKLIPGYKSKAESGMGYFFVFGKESVFCAHDMPDGVKTVGDNFFKEQILKN